MKRHGEMVLHGCLEHLSLIADTILAIAPHEIDHDAGRAPPCVSRQHVIHVGFGQSFPVQPNAYLDALGTGVVHDLGKIERGYGLGNVGALVG